MCLYVVLRVCFSFACTFVYLLRFCLLLGCLACLQVLVGLLRVLEYLLLLGCCLWEGLAWVLWVLFKVLVAYFVVVVAWRLRLVVA